MDFYCDLRGCRHQVTATNSCSLRWPEAAAAVVDVPPECLGLARMHPEPKLGSEPWAGPAKEHPAPATVRGATVCTRCLGHANPAFGTRDGGQVCRKCYHELYPETAPKPRPEVPANPHGYRLDEYGQPVCPRCSTSTNKSCVPVPKLTCWQCGYPLWQTPLAARPGPEPAVRKASAFRETCDGCPKEQVTGAARCQWSVPGPTYLPDQFSWRPGLNCPLGPGPAERTPPAPAEAPRPPAGIMELVADAACGEIGRQTVKLRARVRQLENTLGCMRAALDEYREVAAAAGRRANRMWLVLGNVRGIIGPNAPDPALQGAAEGMAEEIRGALRVIDEVLEAKP